MAWERRKDAGYERKSSGRTQSRNSWEPISSDENTSFKADGFAAGPISFVTLFWNIACKQEPRARLATASVDSPYYTTLHNLHGASYLRVE